jgi:hypothetical protein
MPALLACMMAINVMGQTGDAKITKEEVIGKA